MWRLLLVLVGCSGDPSGKDTEPGDSGEPGDSDSADSAPVDGDGDGYPEGKDCDDSDNTAWPGAPETCDGVDDDCDGQTDEGAEDATPWYRDDDGDSYGDAEVSELACEAPKGFVADATDCDDTRADVHPDAVEEDCADPTDYDCDGVVVYADEDGDGAAACVDCDDGDPTRSPALPELCDELGVDEDCDGLVDDDDPTVSDPTTWHRDADADGYGTDSGATLTQCAQPAGYAAAVGDCDDYDGNVSPDALEVCDAFDVDEDCNGVADDADAGTSAASWTVWYGDRDGDGYGDDSRNAAQCEPPAGYVALGGDCDDGDTERNPGAVEVCDDADRDEDCDGLSDATDPDVEGAGFYYADLDGDGFGTGIPVRACEQGDGYSAEDGDCDDDDGEVHPGAAEVCDAADRDEDCDGDGDEEGASGGSSWYVDADGDGYGGALQSGCERPSGAVDVGGDCDDGARGVNPGAVETCGDGVDADCSGADTVCVPDPYEGSYAVDEDASTMFYGVEGSDSFAYEAAAGDFDGDGLGDLVVAAPFADTPDDPDAGIVYLYSAPMGRGEERADTAPTASYLNGVTTAWVYYGYRLASVGDVDEDGRDDLWMALDSSSGAVFYGGDTGSVYVGSADDLSPACVTGAEAGTFSSRTGVPSWACGDSSASSSAGAVYVFEGATDRSPVLTLSGEAAGDRAGRLAGGQDVDGDGYDDLWVSAYTEDSNGSSSGAAYLVYGPTTGSLSLADADSKVIGGASGDQLGYAVALVPDTDGDGRDELAAGANGADGGATSGGEVYLFADLPRGENTALAVADSRFVGTGYLDGTGAELAAGDVDGDGLGDICIASAGADGGGSEAGAAWLMYAPFSGSYRLGADADAEWLGLHSGAYLGDALSFLPDADGDGDGELVLGTSWANVTGDANQGAVWIWEGR